MKTPLLRIFTAIPVQTDLFRRSNRKGVALVIVLAFIVLLTGVVVAFFSRSITVRQLANANSNRVKADLFAEGAVDTIVSDLKKEIIDRSNATTAGTTTIYIPKTAADAMPAFSGKSANDKLPLNILKQSANGKEFYSGGPRRAANVSSTTPSLNSRYVSLERWNKPLLMPKADPKSDSDLTPDTSGSKSFVAPDWVLVARDGTNPAAADGIATLSNGKFVVGRYAYNIYDEGGLLDMNAAGYPAPVFKSLAATDVNKNAPAYKSALPFADLKQIPGLTDSDLSTTRQDEVISAIAGWRNSSALKPTPGASPDPWYKLTFPTTAAADLTSFVRTSPAGYLSTTPGVFNGSASQGTSDRFFTSRLELIQFMANGLTSDEAERASLQNSLQYLTHFTRALEQPSYAPDTTAPKVQSLANGGNNQTSLDAFVNPNFLAVRVKTAFTRNDSTSAEVGQPLVNKRFALTRLAWLTYKGPSSTRTQSDADMQLLINTHGIPLTFLQLGTAANIKKYFGLTWVPDSGSTLGKWQYNVHNGPNGTGPTGSILRLGMPGDSPSVAGLSGAAAHEPDFFELLKASVSAGSKARVSTVFTSSTSASDVQYQNDVSFDYAIMQLGANIIAQSKVDGFGVRIGFDDGSGINAKKEFQGVENVPYIYRARWGVLKIRNEVPILTGDIPVANAAAGVAPGDAINKPPRYAASQGLLTDPGVSMVMMIPEIWNPYDTNCPLPPASLRPTDYRIVADSIDPVGLANSTAPNQFSVCGRDFTAAGNPYQDLSAGATGGTTPPFSQKKGGTGTEIFGSYRNAASPHSLKPDTTAMTFKIPSAVMFREPTLLARANVPSGSDLKLDNSLWANFPESKDYLVIENTNGVSFGGNGFKADVANPLVLPTPGNVNAATEYVGIPLGVFPSNWIGPRQSFQTPPTATNIYRSYGVAIRTPSGSANITLRLQYKDPSNASNWITYDTKMMSPPSAWLHNILGASPAGGLMQGLAVWQSYTDPRTSRFGGLAASYTSSDTNTFVAPGSAIRTVTKTSYAVSETTPVNPGEWLDQTNDVLMSNRPDIHAGFHFPSPAATGGATASPGWSSPNKVLGMFSQNSMTVVNDALKYSAPFGSNPYAVPTGTNYYSDADGVVRRAMGGYYTSGNSAVGLPMAATYSSTGPIANQSQSRPWILHRPYRSVAELGYVFSDTPWKNLDFFTPESGDAALLDVFCVNETNDSKGMVAGKVNLNTRQAPVLQALFAGAYKDEFNPGTSNVVGGSGTASEKIAQALVDRTTNTATGKGPMQNLSELIGKYAPVGSTSVPIDGSVSYDGFSKDLSTVVGASGSNPDTNMNNIQRFREAVIRPLAASGQTRVWNLMIDLVAQTGRYPTTAKSLDKFIVEGEQRYWVHVAIDRFTGEVLDKQVEVVKE